MQAEIIAGSYACDSTLASSSSRLRQTRQNCEVRLDTLKASFEKTNKDLDIATGHSHAKDNDLVDGVSALGKLEALLENVDKDLGSVIVPDDVKDCQLVVEIETMRDLKRRTQDLEGTVQKIWNKLVAQNLRLETEIQNLQTENEFTSITPMPASVTRFAMS